MHSGDKASPIVYFTLLVGEHCGHMMINRTLEHVHHNVLINSSLLIVNALYPNGWSRVPTLFLKQNSRLFLGYFQISNRYLGHV